MYLDQKEIMFCTNSNIENSWSAGKSTCCIQLVSKTLGGICGVYYFAFLWISIIQVSLKSDRDALPIPLYVAAPAESSILVSLSYNINFRWQHVPVQTIYPSFILCSHSFQSHVVGQRNYFTKIFRTLPLWHDAQFNIKHDEYCNTAIETVKLPDFESAKIHLLTGSW